MNECKYCDESCEQGPFEVIYDDHNTDFCSLSCEEDYAFAINQLPCHIICNGCEDDLHAMQGFPTGIRCLCGCGNCNATMSYPGTCVKCQEEEDCYIPCYCDSQDKCGAPHGYPNNTEVVLF